MPDIPEPIKEQCESKGGIPGIVRKLPPNRVVEERSQMFRALGEPMRQKILLAVAEQPLCACLIRELLGISDSKLSYHHTILKEARLIKGKKDGIWVIYEATKKGNQIASSISKL